MEEGGNCIVSRPVVGFGKALKSSLGEEVAALSSLSELFKLEQAKLSVGVSSL